jgi:hypothetical protein
MKSNTVWTPRAYRLRNFAVAAVFLFVWFQLMELSLPEQCRGVSVREMSDFCLSIAVK